MRYSFGITDYSLPLYIDSLSNNWNQENVDRRMGYPYVHWIQTVSGTGSVMIDNQVIELHVGEGMLIDKDIPHKYYGIDSEWITAYFTFGGELITEILTTLNIKKFIKIEIPDPELLNFVDKCYKKIQNSNIDIYQTSVMVYQLLTLVKKNQIKNNFDERLMNEIITPVLEFIKNNYTSEIRNEDFVKQTNYSLQYILGVFKACLDSSPHKILLDYRIRKAKELLIKSSNMTVEQIGKAVGFNTNSYFISVFKQHEKMTPGQFRAKMV